MAIYIDRKEQTVIYDSQGYSIRELLPGSYDKGIHFYRCSLRAGCSNCPELYADKIVLLLFGFGKGYLTDSKDAYHVDEVSFYAPDFDRVPYTVHAVDNMEFVMAVVDMNQWDWEVFRESHARLPFFRPISKCTMYDQSCKGPEVTSWNVLLGRQLGRIMAGVVRAEGDGTVEKGHPAVHQWNYCLGESDFRLTVDDEAVHSFSGDWSFIPAGLDHSLVAEKKKEVYYIWFEHFAREKDFIVKPDP